MLQTAKQYPSRSENQHVSEISPVFLITVDHESDLGILLNVSNPLEFARRSSLRLLVNREVKIVSVEDEADGDDMGLTGSVRRGEVGDARGAEKGCDVST